MKNEIGRYEENFTNGRMAGEGSSHDLTRTLARKRKAREEISNKHFDQGEPSSRRQKVGEGSSFSRVGM